MNAMGFAGFSMSRDCVGESRDVCAVVRAREKQNEKVSACCPFAAYPHFERCLQD